MEGITVNTKVAVVLDLISVVTERALLRVVADATEYAMIGLAVETTGCDALKLQYSKL